MTDKAYTTADQGIFGVHPCFLGYFYDLPTILNPRTAIGYSRIHTAASSTTIRSRAPDLSPPGAATARQAQIAGLPHQPRRSGLEYTAPGDVAIHRHRLSPPELSGVGKSEPSPIDLIHADVNVF
ncbi:hypothetical protein ACFVAV_07170 [Nocardia sp. NPDC057663]|uniref:hypothetical protein n=1 Tax=Nocardia sp. NPDC057663 TaxID=3346201 RepID=UPI003672C85A